MKAYRAHRLVGLQGLACEDVDAPVPGAGEVVIAVSAAGLELVDLATLSGERSRKRALPFTPGVEVAGTISGVGDGVEGLGEGMPVVAFVAWGGLAETVCTPATLCVPLPDGFAPSQAAALPFAYAGALMALDGKVGPGRTLLVLGAGGHIGLGAVATAKALGATVIAAATGQARREAAEAMKPDHVFDPGLSAIGPTVAELTNGKGVSVVFDPVGGDASAAALPVLEAGGTFLVAGFGSGKLPSFDFGLFYARGARLLAANTFLDVERNPAAARAALERVVAWTQEGRIEPRVAAQFPFAETRHAFDYVAGRRGTGAVIVKVGD